MNDDHQLDTSFSLLSASATATVSDGFLDEVWERVGKLQERADGRRRLALFCGLFVVGLGSGFGAIQAPAAANPAPYQLVPHAELSPSALLHLEP